MIHALRVSARKQYYLVHPNSAILMGSFVWGLAFPIIYPLLYLLSLCLYQAPWKIHKVTITPERSGVIFSFLNY
jgi:hypothetical protein